MLSIQTQTVAVEGGEPASELSIMQKLLMPAAEVLAMDATDFSCGDRWLKGLGENVRAELRTILSFCFEQTYVVRLTWRRWRVAC